MKSLLKKNKKLIIAMSAVIAGTVGIASSIIITDKHQSVEEKLTSAIENVTNEQILKLEQQLQRVSPISYEEYLS
jgi:capsular polysaccharide biosynthesis protein